LLINLQAEAKACVEKETRIMGLLKVKGTLDLSQFWPGGQSDADTAHVLLKPNAFKFQEHPGAPFKVTHVFDAAKVKGKFGTKPAIDKKNRITIRFQGIDATELHFSASPVNKKLKAQMTPAQLAKLKQLNKNYRQFFGETAPVKLHEFLTGPGQAQLPCTVTTAVNSPNDVFDTYGRFVGDILVKIGGQEVNVNHWLVEQGWAFPTFYASMSNDEIQVLLTAAAKGRKKTGRAEKNLQKVVGTLDKTLVFRRRGATFDAAKDKGPALMPKLFRRLCTFTVHKGAGVATGNLHNFIKNSKPADDCFLTNDFLEQGVTAAPVHLLSEFVGNDGKITKEPQELVFRENASTLVGPDGKPITTGF